MTSKDSYYVLAHTIGIDLSKYLSLSELDRIRNLIPKFTVPSDPSITQDDSEGIRTSYPLLTKKFINDGRKIGAEVYPLLFTLENSIRQLIRAKLAADKNWWEEKCPDKVKKSVSYLMNKEQLFTFRTKRGNDQLDYANFEHLSLIIDFNKDVFKDVIYDFEWFRVWMSEIYLVRNNIAHCVPISKDDRERISIFHKAWANMLKPRRS